MKVLNVAGGSRDIPEHYAEFEQILLDIDERTRPDVQMDAMDLYGNQVLKNEFDAVWFSHGIEHFYAHQVPKLLKGILWVLKPGGLGEFQVPNMRQWLIDITSRGHDLSDTWYRTQDDLPVTYHDVIYGWGRVMEGGNLYYAHKSAYTPWLLADTLSQAGFERVRVREQHSNLWAEGRKCL